MDTPPTQELFRAINVWQRISAVEVARFRCFQSLVTGKYSVQSEDHYHLPLDAKQVASLETQFLEMLAEQSPAERSAGHDSLSEAISAHRESFADFWTEGWPQLNEE